MVRQINNRCVYISQQPLISTQYWNVSERCRCELHVKLVSFIVGLCSPDQSTLL